MMGMDFSLWGLAWDFSPYASIPSGSFIAANGVEAVFSTEVRLEEVG